MTTSPFPTKEVMAWFYDINIYQNKHRDDLLAWKWFTNKIVDVKNNKTPEDYRYNASLDIGQTVVSKKMAEWISNSFARVNVYFSDVTMLEKGQSESYHWTDLLADVGGILGLWVGVSFITIFEFFNLFVQFIKGMADRVVNASRFETMK